MNYKTLTLLAGVLFSACSPTPVDQRPVLGDAEMNEVTDSGLLSDGMLTSMDADQPSSTDLGTNDGSTNADLGVASDGSIPIDERLGCGELSYAEPQTIYASDTLTVLSGISEIGNGHQGSCGGIGSESLLVIEDPMPGIYRIKAEFKDGHAPVLFARETCEVSTTERTCNADLDAFGRSELNIENSLGTPLYLFVDSWQPSAPAEFTIRVTHSDEHRPAEIKAARIAIGPHETLVVDWTVDDVNDDIQSIDLLAPDESVIFPVDFRAPLETPTTEISGRTMVDSMAQELDGWRIRVLDSQGNISESELIAVPTSYIQLDQTCDEDSDSIQVCADELFCTYREQQRVCQPARAPIVENVRVFQRERQFFVQGWVSDPDVDMNGGILQLYGESEQLIETFAFTLPHDRQTAFVRESFLQTSEETVINAALEVTDLQGLSTNVTIGSLEEPAIVPIGSACTTSDAQQLCENGSYCNEDCDAYDECPPIGICAQYEMPTVGTASLSYNWLNGALQLSATINDPSRVFRGIVVTDADTQREFPLKITQWDRVDDTVLQGIETLFINQSTAPPTSLSLGIVDRFNRSSTPIALTPTDVTELDLGEGCTVDAREARCAAGTACVSSEQTMRCTEVDVPIITNAQLFYHADTERAGVLIEGIEQTQLATSFLLKGTDPSGEVSYTRTPLVQITRSGIDFQVMQPIAYSPNFANESQFSIALVDETGAYTEWRPLTRNPPPNILPGEQCALNPIFGVCSEDSFCEVNTDETIGICVASGGDCPEDWMVSVYDENDAEGMLTGDSRSAFSPLVGACNPGLSSVIHEFVPASSGLYVHRVKPMGETPIQYPRIFLSQSCTQPDGELACSQSSSVLYEAVAQQTYFIGVSAPPIALEMQGTYALDIYRHVPPSITSATPSMTSEDPQFSFRIEFEAGTESIASVEMKFFDADGRAVWTPSRGDEWRQGFLIDPNAENQGTFEVSLDDAETMPAEVQLKLIDALGESSAPFDILLNELN